MECHQVSQDFSPLGCELDAHEAAIARNDLLANQISLRRAIHQPHDRVMSFLQKIRQLGDGRPPASCESSNAQHQLMLLRCYARGTRGVFAESEKSPKLVAKVREFPGNGRCRMLPR